MSKRTFMVATFDVTDLDEQQRDRLAGEVSVQAESTDDDSYLNQHNEFISVPGKPDVPYPEIKFLEVDAA